MARTWGSRVCAGLLLAQTMWLVPEAPGAGVVYRFRPGSPELSSNYVAENVEVGPFLDQRELAARGPGGWGLSPPITAEFLGAASTFRSDGVAASNQPLGPRLTVEIWIRPTDTSGIITLLTNRAPGGNGFELGLANGMPFFELVVGSETFRVEGSVSGHPGGDAWLAAVVHNQGGTLRLTLYRDGEKIAESETAAAIASPYVIEAPFYVGTRAEGNASSPTLVGTFTGHVYAAVVRDYLTHPSYLSSGVPFDGSEYFGLPAYHDYPLGDFHLPMDQRIDSDPVEIRRRVFVPYANDEFIPQGTATRIEQRPEGDAKLIYVSYYHRTREGAIGTLRSIVAEIDEATGRVRRTFRLRGQLEYSHAGGIAFAHDALFVSSVGFLERYPIPPFDASQSSKYLDLLPDESGSISVESKSSFVSAFADTLWVGDWRPANDVAPFLYAYPLKADGRPEMSPAYIFALPRNVQGVDLFRHNGETYVFMSRNRNSSQAEVLRYRRQRLDRNAVSAADTAITMPYGIEDLSFFPDGTLWTSSESGTVFYQRQDADPWTTFYPFVYSVPPQILLPGAVSIGVEARPGRSGLEIESYPNPLSSSAKITISLSQRLIAHVYIFDILGKKRATLWEGPIAPGASELHWNVADNAAGIYFAVIDTPSGRWVKPLVVVP